jgi:hypothetical protein
VQDTVEIVVRGGGCGAGTGSSAGAFERRQRDALPRCTHNTTVNQELQYAFPPLLSLPPSLFSISISPSTLPLFSLPPRQDGCRESQGRRGASACEMKHAHARVRMPEKRAHATHQDLRKVYCSSTYQDLRSFGLPQMEQPLNLVCGQHESRQPGPGQPYNTEDGGSDARPCGRVRLHCTLRRLRHDHGKHVMRGGGTHWRDSAHLCVHAIHKDTGPRDAKELAASSSRTSDPPSRWPRCWRWPVLRWCSVLRPPLLRCMRLRRCHCFGRCLLRHRSCARSDRCLSYPTAPS